MKIKLTKEGILSILEGYFVKYYGFDKDEININIKFNVTKGIVANVEIQEKTS